jgi:hypothetical protein
MTGLRALFVLALASISTGSALAQARPHPEPRYPKLASSATSAEGFAPSGWTLEAHAEGDLDGDGAADLAVVLRGTDPALVMKNDGLGEAELDTNPRILAVALRRNDRFELVAQNHTLIPRRDDPVVEDPFERSGVEIQRRTLRVSLSFFMSAGGWEMFTSTFTFKLDEERQMRLIGFDRHTRHRNTGANSTISANFLTGRARVETAPNDEAKPHVRWKSVSKRLLPIERIGSGLEFQIKGDS